MLIPNTLPTRINRRIVVDAPHQLASIRAPAAAGAVGRSAYALYQRAPVSARRVRLAERALAEDTTAALVELRAISAETMVRAMIAAAAADGEIDDQEQQRILSCLKDSAATPAEYAHAGTAMHHPDTPEELARLATDREAAIEIYAAALLATDAATHGGREFLAQLADALVLPTDFVAELHASWGDPAPLTMGLAYPRRP